jgi:hypothetical protein
MSLGISTTVNDSLLTVQSAKKIVTVCHQMLQYSLLIIATCDMDVNLAYVDCCDSCAVHKVMLTLLLDLKASLRDLGQQVTTLTEAVKDLQPSSTGSSSHEIHSDVVLPLTDQQSLDKLESLMRSDDRL